MVRLIAKKSVELLMVLFFVTLIVFFTFRMLPGNPAQMMLGLNPTPEAVKALTVQMGLDKPLIIQYATWLGQVLHGDLGKSMLGGQSVISLLAVSIPKTFELAILGMILALIIAIPTGVISTIAKNGWADRVSRLVSLFGFSTPAYWLAVLLMLLFAYEMHLFPAGGYVDFTKSPMDHVRSLVLPVFTVGIINAAQAFRFLRSGMLDVIGQDYIRTARAKGVSEVWVIFKHVARNALPNLITVVALNFSLLLSGMVVTEQIFAWPGIGWLTIQSILNRDYTVVQGAVLASAIIIVLINFASDTINSIIDPRIRVH